MNAIDAYKDHLRNLDVKKDSKKTKRRDLMIRAYYLEKKYEAHMENRFPGVEL